MKEMRLASVDTPEAGNVFLPGFLEAHNARFAKARRHANATPIGLLANRTTLARSSPGRRSGR